MDPTVCLSLPPQSPGAPGPPPPSPASAQAQTNNKLKVLLENVQSLPPKMDEIIVLT